MSRLDKIGATVFPLASDEKRAEAGRNAEECERSGDKPAPPLQMAAQESRGSTSVA